ncbi:MAG: ferritin family protein [bacterium]
MNTFEEIIQFAIESEYKAAAFYQHMLTLNQAAGMRSFFERLVKQEMGHAAKLKNISKHQVSRIDNTDQPDPGLSLADYLVVSVDDESNLSYQDAVILAMKKEKAAVQLYQDLMNKTADPELKALFAFIMEEEKGHQAAFEDEYDKRIQSDN